MEEAVCRFPRAGTGNMSFREACGNVKLIYSQSSHSPSAVSGSRSRSRRWGPSGASCGRRADSLCDTRRRTRHTGSTAPCPAGAAYSAERRRAPPPRLPARPHPRRHRPPWRKRKSRRRRSRRRRRRTTRMRERAAKAGGAEGVSWDDLAVC